MAELTAEEALVVHEVLARWSDEDRDPAAHLMQVGLLDKAEWQAMNNLLCVLESQVEWVVSPEYAERLAAAKATLSLQR